MATLSNSLDNLQGPRLVRDQLERLLVHPLFCHSRRYPLLLREVVERALEGHAADSKERVLGVEVFGRDPGYDTGADPVVRITAGEIRKRLERYYHDPQHSDELQISLPPGSYVPQFKFPKPEAVMAEPAVIEIRPPAAVIPPAFVSGDEPVKADQGRRRRLLLFGLGIAAVVLVLSFALARSRAREMPVTALDQFWQPMIEADRPAVICVGKPPLVIMPAGSMPTVPIGEAVVLSQVSGLLGAKHKAFRVVNDVATHFADLRSGPVILIGGLKNDWTLRLLKHTRFYLDSDGVVDQIRDRENPNQHFWGNARVPLQKDYALISRLLDPTLGHTTVIASGIYRYGTLAASEFLTDPQYLEQWAARAPAGWQKKNLQIVISTDVIDSHPGAPHVEAFRVW